MTEGPPKSPISEKPENNLEDVNAAAKIEDTFPGIDATELSSEDLGIWRDLHSDQGIEVFSFDAWRTSIVKNEQPDSPRNVFMLKLSRYVEGFRPFKFKEGDRIKVTKEK